MTVSGLIESLKTVSGVVLRWVNATNYAFLTMEPFPPLPTNALLIKLGTVVAGTPAVLAETVITSVNPPDAFSLTLSATLDGQLKATGNVLETFAISGSSAAIATAGALASGKAGIYQQSGVASVTTVVESITVQSLPAIPYVVQSERSMEARSDSTLTFDSTGTYAGPVPEYRGSRFYVPQDGSANRTSRILVKADRNDLEEADQQTIADAFTAQVFVTPRYSVIPR